MPSVWKRMQEMFTANSHAQLDQLENPAHMSQQLLRDLDDELDTLRRELLASVSREHKIESSLKALRSQALNHQQQARRALARQDEAPARHHLKLTLKLDAEVSQMEQLAAQQARCSDGLRNERSHLLREREELTSQARVISLRSALQVNGGDISRDLYSKSLQRRERMARYSERLNSGLDELVAAQTLRAEEIGQVQLDDDDALDEAVNSLKRQLETEDAA